MIKLTQDRSVASKMLALGVLLAALLASLMIAAKPAHADTTFTVVNTNDSGAGSLRQAMFDANVTPGADVIEFNIPGGDVHTIAPSSALPKITGPVTINGYSQPGTRPNGKAVGSDAVLKIQLSGANAGNADGLWIGAANSVVKGLALNLWNTGIRIEGSAATGNRITGNFIGTHASGTQDLGNSRGVYVASAPGNTIGGATFAARNVISGNEGNGVDVDGGDGNVVAGNYIGTKASGAQDLGNAGTGIDIESASNTTVGGTTTAERNVISANGSEGVEIEGDTATGNKIAGNFIGTDGTGTAPLGNVDQGLLITLAQGNVIGGTTSAARNVISGNEEEGVFIGMGADGNSIQGNFIGTDKNGAAPLGNDNNGVEVFRADNNTIGGTQAGARNVISANGENGVSVWDDDSATGNRVLSNSIFANGGLGIDLGDDGPTPNDLEDADTGPNGLQNRPVLSSARKNSSGTTTVRGRLNSTPDKTFRVEFFINPKGTNEGKTFLGSRLVSTDGSGDVTFAFSTKKPIRLGQNVTATATGPGGNTSEFSAPKQVVAS